MTMKTFLVILVALALVLAAGCAPGPNTAEDIPSLKTGKVAGFWRGLWQGVISPITFVISLFTGQISPYEVHNNGGWYNLGFGIGLAIVLGGGGASSSRKGRKGIRG